MCIYETEISFLLIAFMVVIMSLISMIQLYEVLNTKLTKENQRTVHEFKLYNLIRHIKMSTLSFQILC